MLPYSIFWACSRSCSINTFSSTDACVVRVSTDFEPSVFDSRLNSCIRKSSFLPAAPPPAAQAPATPSPEVEQRQQEVRREVALALAALPLRYRVPLVLYEIEGWPYLDIARQLALSEGTIKSRIHRGRERLRRRLASYWYGGLAWKTSE